MKLPILKTLCAVALLAPALVHAASSTSSPRIDPKATAELRRMSNALAAAKAFTYRTKTTLEVPAKNGQFLTIFSTADVALKRPDKLRAHLTGEAPHFEFFYDGSVAAAFAPAANVYSLSKAPSTIDAMLPALENETGIRFATAGLLFSNPYSVMTRGLTSGLYVGVVNVDGTPCEHLAFRGDGVNWEIWIESGSRALPRRLAVTYTDRANLPRVLVELSNWNLHPGLHPGDFTFRPPAGSREIPFLSVIKH